MYEDDSAVVNGNEENKLDTPQTIAK